jgi:DNA-binding XRE family transcriptional regulator
MGSATRSRRYREFLKKLRAARKAAGLTQVEVASIAFTQEPDP